MNQPNGFVIHVTDLRTGKRVTRWLYRVDGQIVRDVTFTEEGRLAA